MAWLTKLQRFVFSALLCLLLNNYPAQNKTDSLYKLLLSARHDTSRVRLLDLIAASLHKNYPDSAFKLWNSALTTGTKNIPSAGAAEQNSYKRTNAYCLNGLAVSSYYKGDFDEAIKYAEQGLKAMQELNIPAGIAAAYTYLGNNYMFKGAYAKAVDFYMKGLAVSEKNKNYERMADLQMNIAAVYESMQDFEASLKYNGLSLELRKKLGDQSGMASALNNIGNIYFRKGDYKKALEYHLPALKIREEAGDLLTFSQSLMNVGFIYYYLGDINKAIDYGNQGIKILERLGNKYYISLSLKNLGQLKIASGKVKEGLSDCSKGLDLAKEIGALDAQKLCFECLREGNETAGNFKRALMYERSYSALKDSMVNEATTKAIAKREAEYDFEKQKAVAEKEHEKQMAVASEREQRQKIISLVIAAGLILLLFFTIFVFNRLKVTRKQKKIIEHHKAIVEEKQKEIMDSITYAKRIQRAHLPTEKYVTRNLERLKDN